MGSSTLCVAFAFLRYPRISFSSRSSTAAPEVAQADNEREARGALPLMHSLTSKAMFGLSTGADRERKDCALCGMRRQVVPAHREAR